MLLSLFLVSCYSARTPETEISDKEKILHENKMVVKKLYTAINESNWNVAKTLVDKDFKHYYVKDTAFAAMDWNGFERGNQMARKAFPDWQLNVLIIVAEGEYVSVLLKGQGTHLGAFAGIQPTNINASAPIMMLHQIKNGKIIADWEVANMDLFLKQLEKK